MTSTLSEIKAKLLELQKTVCVDRALCLNAAKCQEYEYAKNCEANKLMNEILQLCEG